MFEESYRLLLLSKTVCHKRRVSWNIRSSYDHEDDFSCVGLCIKYVHARTYLLIFLAVVLVDNALLRESIPALPITQFKATTTAAGGKQEHLHHGSLRRPSLMEWGSFPDGTARVNL
jgi:hypothetical protein